MCAKCQKRHHALDWFLDLPTKLLRALLVHSDAHRHLEAPQPVRIITSFGVGDGAAGAARTMEMMRTALPRLQGCVHVAGGPSADSIEEMSTEDVKRTLTAWVTWADAIRARVRPAGGRARALPNTTLNIYRFLRLLRLVPPLTNWEDAQLAEGRGRNVDIAEEQRKLTILDRFCEVIGKAHNKMLDFVRRVLKEQGEPVSICARTI
jgi:hypothetical protein